MDDVVASLPSLAREHDTWYRAEPSPSSSLNGQPGPPSVQKPLGFARAAPRMRYVAVPGKPRRDTPTVFFFRKGRSMPGVRNALGSDMSPFSRTPPRHCSRWGCGFEDGRDAFADAVTAPRRTLPADRCWLTGRPNYAGGGAGKLAGALIVGPAIPFRSTHQCYGRPQLVRKEGPDSIGQRPGHLEWGAVSNDRSKCCDHEKRTGYCFQPKGAAGPSPPGHSYGRLQAR